MIYTSNNRNRNKILLLSPQELLVYFYPNFYEINDLSNAKVIPPLIRLTKQTLKKDRIYLLDDCLSYYIWTGSDVPYYIKLNVPEIKIIEKLNTNKTQFQPVYIINEGDDNEIEFLSKFIEDKSECYYGNITYKEYYELLNSR